MNDLERRALLGDKEAQMICAEKGIVLKCPCCGGTSAVCFDISAPESTPYSCSCLDCGLEIHGKTEEEVVSKWNARPWPPIGRCKDCANRGSYDSDTCRYGLDDDFCSNFDPKEEASNE